MSIQTRSVIELREVSISKSNQRNQSRTAWSLYLNEQTFSESASMTSSMQWSSHHSIYQWIDSSISSRATSESASMTSILNAMIYKHIALFISESIRLSVHVQLVSLLQWRVQSRSLWWASRSVSLLQWHRQCNDLLIALSISESIRLSVHVQLVSLLQWRAQSRSLRWASRSMSLLQWHFYLA